MAKFAIGYVRGRRFNGKWCGDAKAQRRQILDYAEAYDFTVIKILIEEQKFSLFKQTGGRTLATALSLCKDNKGTLLYVDIGRWRRSPLFVETIKKIQTHKNTKKLYSYKIQAIPAERKTIELIERQAREEKYYESFGIKKVKKKTVSNVSDLMKWKQDNKIGTKRFNNFKHLYKGVEPIYRIFEKHTDSKIIVILDILIKGHYLTVDGKRWNKDNVRKTRANIESDDFQEFIRICDEEKED